MAEHARYIQMNKDRRSKVQQQENNSSKSLNTILLNNHVDLYSI